MRSRGTFLALLFLAAALRLPSLASRPLHADEGVHADKFGTLLDGGGYAYDPAEYHGPTLYYLTLVPARLRGQSRYLDLDEVTLRLVPAVLGLALVGAHVLARASLGWPAAAIAALLAAISPAMVFYSRYYIHETPLVVFTFGVLLAADRYRRAPGAIPALLIGAFSGLMIATKETAPLAMASMLGALVLTRLTLRGSSIPSPMSAGKVEGRHRLLALLAAVLVAAVLFSSFFTHAAGLPDAVRAYALYLERAQSASWHFHSWPFYLRLLLHFPASGTPFWTEGLILFLAVVGAAAGWAAPRPSTAASAGPGEPGEAEASGTEPAVLRFLAFYTLLMVVAYSAIPYKTPWCLLGFLHGMILLAGAGAAWLLRSLRRPVARVVVPAALVVAAAHLGWQAFSGSFRFAADPRNPYVYAHTGPDVFVIARRVRDIARAHPDGTSMPIQIMSGENLWPLPFYLRGLTHVEWWNGVPESAPSAPLILVTPDLEPALVRKLYDLPPPGERALYVSVFERPVELRPRVELRGFAVSRLWEDHLRSGGGAAPPLAGAASAQAPR